MAIRSILCVAILAGALAGMATSAAQSGSVFQATLAETNQKTGEVSTEQLQQILRDGSAIILDTRSRLEFEAGHISGAQVLDVTPEKQVSEITTLVGGDKAKALVLYCNGPYCQASRRVADQLLAAGFANVRRYQLGIPVWRALGGPTALEIGGATRVFGHDKTAVFIDARSADDFANGTLPGAVSAPIDDLLSGKLKKIALPDDDFNRRVILFGRDGDQARRLAEALRTRPWHNVSYVSGSFEDLAKALRIRRN